VRQVQQVLTHASKRSRRGLRALHRALGCSCPPRRAGACMQSMEAHERTWQTAACRREC
jgi:hypothetical protein